MFESCTAHTNWYILIEKHPVARRLDYGCKSKSVLGVVSRPRQNKRANENKKEAKQTYRETVDSDSALDYLARDARFASTLDL